MNKIQITIRDARALGLHDDAPVYHGGDLAAARRLYPEAPAPWIDLSTGINPHAYPLPVLPPEAFTRLPDGHGLAALEAAAARRYGVPATATLVAAPGTQALIQLLPHIYKAKHVGILGFTYGEYARLWHAAGLTPAIVEDIEALRACDLAIIVNPNNPDGRLVPAQALAALAAHLASKGGLLVVDEAFADLLPQEQSLAPLLPEAGALVLRSFGKVFGLPGVRLGFAATNPELAAKIRALLGPWAVSGPAIAIGALALDDDRWIAALPPRLARQSQVIEDLFKSLGAEKIGATPLFQLFAHPQTEAIFSAFGQRGVWLRRFPEKSQWLRVGLCAPESEARLASVAALIAKDHL